MRSLLILLMLVGFAFSVQAGTKKIPFKICYEDVPQPPYYFGEGSTVPAEKPGIYVEISKFLEKRLDLSITHFRAPWKRCLALLQKNTVDAVYGASFEERRLVHGRYPMKDQMLDEDRRIATKSYSLYKNRDVLIDWDGVSLINVSEAIGAPLGYSIIPFLENHGAVVETRWSTELGLSLVSMGRISSFAAQDTTADALIGGDPERYTNVEKVVPPLQTKPYFMMISHGFYEHEEELSETIWSEIIWVRERELPELFRQYLK